MLEPDRLVCDHCDQELHRDACGWFVGSDETADCAEHALGHEVNGQVR